MVEMNGGSFYAQFHFPSGWPHCFQMCTLFGAYYTFCIYFNFKIVLNKFIRLAVKLNTLSIVGTGDLYANICF